MATFLDITALENFSVIFVFLLVWIIVYAILLYTKVLGQNQFVSIITGLVFAILAIMSPLATLIVKSIIPFVAVVLILVIIVTSTSGMFGKVDVDSLPGLKGVVIVILVIALIVGSLAIVRENIKVPERGEDFGKVSTVIFHPNFLGMVLLLLIAVFTVGLLAAKQT
jgi:uncharacterized membrane protein YozB (DUF420 family)